MDRAGNSYESVLCLETAFASFESVPPPEHGARSAIHVATSPELSGRSGGYFYLEREDERLSPVAQDEALAQALWDRSIEYIGAHLTSAEG